MAFKLISVKCPDCGQTLSIEENRSKAFCSYCGAQILINNDNEFVFRHVDEASIQKAETERIVHLREFELAKKNSGLWRALTVVWLLLSIVLITIAVIIMLSEGNGDMPGWAGGFLFLFYACAPIIGGGGYLVFKWLPEKETEKTIERKGGIRFPNGLTPFSDKKYIGVKEALHTAGFTNITCINLHDLNFITGLISGDKIDKITINGKQITSGGKIYLPDDAIVITYHGQ